MARQSYSKEFKAGVALDALKGQKTVGEIASEYKIHPNQVGQCVKKGQCILLLENGDIYGPSRVARIKFDRQSRNVAYIYPACC